MPFISFAQNLEDVILHRALRGIEQGFYVDVGANSPDEHSVTRAFYERGWRGINIEPVMEFHQQLLAARPRDINLPIAVADTSGFIDFYDVPGTGLSTISSKTAEDHRAAGYQVVKRHVAVETLDEVFGKYVSGDVHFLKIDVEGLETSVLRGVSLVEVRPWIIVVEATEVLSEVQNHASWEHLVKDRGYSFVYFDGLNRFYVAEERSELARSFQSPPNIFDDWVRAHDWVTRLQVATLSNQLAADSAALDAEREVHRAALDAEREAHRTALDAEREVRRAEAQAKIAELDVRTREQAVWRADVEARLAEWQRVGSENVALRQRITELDAIVANLNRYIGDVQVSMSWRLTAPVRAAKRALDTTRVNLTMAPGSRSRRCAARMVRAAIRLAAGHPLVRRALLPILMRYPALERTARALTSRPSVVHAPPPEPDIVESAPLAETLVARPLSATERNVEATLRRALARTR